MSKGTVLYIGGFELPDKNAAAHRVLNNAKILRDIGYNVKFLGVDKSNNGSKIKEQDVQGFEYWAIPRAKSTMSELRYYFSISFFKKMIKKNNDVKIVICYNYQSGAFLRIKSYCKKNNIKLIADCTEWYTSANKIRSIDSNIRMSYIQKNIDGVICISSYLESYYKNHIHTILLPPLVDKSEEKWGYESIDFGDNKLHFVYSGTPGKNKDKLNLIIDVLDELSNGFRLHIIGISKEQYLSAYPEHADNLEKLSGIVDFVGRVSHTESFKYVKSADFVIFIRESTRTNNAGFPTKYVESSSAGTPVITTKTSDLGEYIKQGENGFIIDGYDKKAIYEALEKVMMLSENEMSAIKEYCRAHKDDFDYKKFVYQMDEFVKAV